MLLLSQRVMLLYYFQLEDKGRRCLWFSSRTFPLQAVFNENIDMDILGPFYITQTHSCMALVGCGII